MTYRARSRRVRTHRGRVVHMGSLGDLVDWAASLETKAELNCLNQANASPSVAAIDAKTEDLARNWKPTGFYKPSEVQSILTSLLVANTQARAVLGTAPLSTGDAQTMIKQAHAYLDRNQERAKIYQTALANAASSGTTVIDAPGLKDWVLKSMVNISQAYVTAAVLSCRSTWLDTAANVITGIWNTAKRVVGIIIKAGDTLLKVADDAFDLYPYIKWGAIGLGAYLIYDRIIKRRRA